MKKTPYQTFSKVGMFFSVFAIIVLMLTQDVPFRYNETELEEAIRDVGALIAIIGCCICLLGSLILRAIGLVLESVRTEYCQGCGKPFDKLELKKIDSGQELCPECINNLNKKKG